MPWVAKYVAKHILQMQPIAAFLIAASRIHYLATCSYLSVLMEKRPRSSPEGGGGAADGAAKRPKSSSNSKAVKMERLLMAVMEFVGDGVLSAHVDSGKRHQAMIPTVNPGRKTLSSYFLQAPPRETDQFESWFEDEEIGGVISLQGIVNSLKAGNYADLASLVTDIVAIMWKARVCYAA
eukprot:gene21920-24860_t